MRLIKWRSETRIGNELTESERVFQKFEVWTHHGLKATQTRKERKMVKLATFTLTFLIFGSLAFLMPTVQTQDIPIPSPVPVSQTFPLEGNMTFTLYPDESIKMKFIGSTEQTIDAEPPPVYAVSFNVAYSPSGVNVTETKGTFVMKFNPMYSMLLSALDLDIEIHSEDLRSNTTILFNLPGYLGVNGSIGAVADESIGENTFDFALTTKIWYTVIPQEEIQEVVQMAPMLISQIETQLSELTEENITLQDLTFNGEIGDTSATIKITGSLVGDFVKGGNALATNYLALLGITDPRNMPWISPEELMSLTKTKSADLHIRFDRNKLAFLMDSESVIEGDMDKMINLMKNIWLEQYLQDPYLLIEPESALIINNFLLPTDISTENLNIAFEYSFDGENIKVDFAVEGLGLRPPTTEAFITILDKALTGASLPGFSLVLEGGSDEEGFVEIEVPSATSEPVIESPRKVVWIVDNLVNLNLVSIKVREWPTLTLTVSQTKIVEGDMSQTEVVKDDTVNIDGVLSIEGEPVEGQEVDVAVNDMVVGTVETDHEGVFSFTHKFVDTGSYDVKLSCEYYEKILDSPITTVTVKLPSLLLTGLVVPAIGLVIAVVVVGYIWMKRK